MPVIANPVGDGKQRTRHRTAGLSGRCRPGDLRCNRTATQRWHRPSRGPRQVPGGRWSSATRYQAVCTCVAGCLGPRTISRTTSSRAYRGRHSHGAARHDHRYAPGCTSGKSRLPYVDPRPLEVRSVGRASCLPPGSLVGTESHGRVTPCDNEARSAREPAKSLRRWHHVTVNWSGAASERWWPSTPGWAGP